MIIRPNQPSQPADKSNFSNSGGGKHIPDFSYAKSLLNELSCTLVARAEVTFSDNLCSIPKLSEQDYTALSQLPSPDLVEIFKDALSCDEFKGKPQSEIIKHIKEFLKEKEGHSSYDKYFNKIRSKILILRGEEFKNTSAFLLKNAPPKQGELFYFEIFKMAQEEKKSSTVKRYSKTAASKEFADFCNILRTEHGISPYDDIIKTLNHYIDPAERQYLKSSQSKELVKILKKHFPKLNFEDLHWTYALNNILNALNKENLENAVKEKMKFYPIIKSYGGEISNISDLTDFLTTPAEIFALLNAPQAKETWDYLKNNHKSKINISSSYILKDFLNLLKELDRLRVSIKELDEFLRIFSISLEKVDEINGLRFKELSPDEIKTALNEPDFKNYIVEFFAKYPELKENILEKSAAKWLLDNIEFLARQYKNKESFYKKTSEYLETRESGFAIRDLSILEDAEFINLVLSKFKKVYNNSSAKIDPEEMRSAIQKINNGQAEKFYNVLVGGWGLERIELSKFLLYLANGKEEFYINAGNIKKFEELNKKYIITPENEDMEISHLIDLPRTLVGLLLENQEFLCNDTTINNFCRYFPDKIKTRNNKKQVCISDLECFTDFKVLRSKEFPEIFEKKYGFSPRDFSVITFLQNMDEGFLSELKNPDMLNNFKNLKLFYRAKNINIDCKILFSMTFLRKDLPLLMKALAALDEYGVNIGNAVMFYSLADKDVLDNINNHDFFAFHEKVTAHFGKNKFDIINIYHISKLYDEVKNNSNLESLLFSDEYKKFIEYIQIKFVIPELNISSILPALRVAEHFDKEKLEKAIEYLEENGEKVKINDLTMILEVVKNKDLECLLHDKAAIIAEIVEIFNVPSAPRKDIDELFEDGSYFGKNMEEAKKLKCPDSERPSKEELKKWPAKELLRVVMLKRSLENPEFLRQIAVMLIKDLNNINTEIGGEIDINGGKGVALREIPSENQNDNSYNSPPIDDIGFAAFHCHCHTRYSSPSMPDKEIAEKTGLINVVFSNLGYPKDASGKEDKNKLLINVDLYFVIDGKTYILDIGVRFANL